MQQAEQLAAAARDDGQPSGLVLPFGDSAVGRLFANKRAYAKTRLGDFRAHLEATDNAGRHCPDEMLCRFVESHITVKGSEVRDVNIKAASEAIAATVRWRAEFGASELRSCECCDKDPFAHCLFSIGTDRRGWEVAYSCAGRTTKKDPTTISRHLVAFLEETFARAERPPTHFGILLDLHGLGVGDLDPRVAVRAITILLTHYPDRVGQVAIVDAPWFFSGIWSILCKAIDPLSQQKARFLTRGAQTEEYLSTYLTPAQGQFMREMLTRRARPHFDSFTPLTATVRRSLGPGDAFTRNFPVACPLASPAASAAAPPASSTPSSRAHGAATGQRAEELRLVATLHTPRSGVVSLPADDVQIDDDEMSA